MWDLPWLAAELQDWYNRNSQIWAVKELCQSFLTGNQPHTHTRRALDPSTFWGATIASNKSPLIYLKLRKLSPSLHPPAPGSSKERGGGKKKGMSRPAWIPEAAPGCLEPAPASPSTHGVVVLCDHRRAHKVALTPIHLSTLVGKYARHRQAPREKGEEKVSGGHRGGEGCTPKENPDPHTCGTSQPSPAQCLTRLPRTHPLPNTHPTAQEFLSLLDAGVANRPRKCSWTQDGHQSMALTSLLRCRCCHTTLPHFCPVLVTLSSPFSSLSL